MRLSLASLALFALLAVAHTWPLASAPATLSRNDAPDAVLNEWIVSWLAHQAVHDPAHLLDANIFYPEKRTLAYSEYLIAPAAMGAPLLWVGASPVLVYNLLLIAGLTLTAWTTACVVGRWTGDAAAGVLSGCLAAFNAHTLTRLPHLQAIHFEFFPLALYAFDRMLTRRRAGDAVLFVACVVLQGLTSYYSLVFMVVAFACGLVVRPSAWTKEARQVLPLVGGAVAVAGLLMFPFLLAYLATGQVRPLDEIWRDSATWRDYLNTPARIHAAWSAEFGGGASALYPGIVAVAFTAVAIASGVARTDPRARTVLAFGVAGIALSFGLALPGYALLYHVVVPLQGIRNAARFGYLGLYATAVLAGFGLHTIRQRWPTPVWWPAVTAAIIGIATIDVMAAPIEYVRAAPVPRLARALKGTTAIVAHIPFFAPSRIFHNADYLLESTVNWRPMINGYSGLVPDSYEAHAGTLARFPSPAAIQELRRLGVTHVWVHDRLLRDWTDNETADAVRNTPALQLLANESDLFLYRVKRSDEE